MGNRYGLRVGRVMWVKRLCCIALEVSGGYSFQAHPDGLPVEEAGAKRGGLLATDEVSVEHHLLLGRT